MTIIHEGVAVASLVLERAVPSATRDGVTLRATVYRTGEPRPVVLVRNPYGEMMTRSIPVAPLTDAGFAVVIQDCRGSGQSDGDFVPFEAEENDTLDAIEWCAAQPWSSGDVVMYGASYSGMVQMAAAARTPDALRAIIPIVTPDDYHSGLAYRGGAFALGQLTGWYTLKSMQTLLHRAARGEDVREGMQKLGRHSQDVLATMMHLPVTEAPFVSEILPSWGRWLEAGVRNEYWDQLSYGGRRHSIAVPGLHVGGWFDLFLGGTLDNFRTLRAEARNARARSGQRLVVGPWSHVDQTGTVGELSFGPQGSALGVGLERMETDFLRAALDPDAEIPGPVVRVFVMGAGRWRTAEEWPIPGTDWQPWHLSAGGVLAPAPPSEADAFTEYAFDPADPTPTVGGQTLMTGGRDGGVEWAPGPRDQSVLDDRTDIVRFASAPLVEDLEVIGPVTATLHVSTDATDADFIARLVDVWPDGRAMSVVSGIVRLSRREGPEAAPRAVEPGSVYSVEIDMWATGQLFRAGHCVRVDIASASFPEFDRNGGIGPHHAWATTLGAARQRIHHDGLHPSFITLPVVPAVRPTRP